jgi:very-short-patch-repair endonuclease
MYQNANQREFSRALRKNMTDAERRLWSLLRREQLHGYKFRRQAAIGDYVVDFVCFSEKLIIELDGGQHNEARAIAYDRKRSTWLQSEGVRVLRFWNYWVFENSEGIVEVIWRELQASRSSLPPSPTLPTEGRE